MPAGKDPLHLGTLLAQSQGRWNRRGDYAALYTACTSEGARAEWRRLRAGAGSAMGQRDLVSLDVVVSPVLDLTDAGNYQDLARRAGINPNPQFLADLAAVPHAHCQKLADQARAEEVTAVLVPSAAAQGEKNLVIYIDVVAPKHVQLANGPDRTRLA